uniref:Uncharacterized protein n=1 Tax=Anguilla anguilla TaxID=7936 RepID=A0A0E9PEI7_ANGAN
MRSHALARTEGGIFDNQGSIEIRGIGQMALMLFYGGRKAGIGVEAPGLGREALTCWWVGKP